MPRWAPSHGHFSGSSLSQPAEVGVGIVTGACAGPWALGILLFAVLFLTYRGRGASGEGNAGCPGPLPYWPDPQGRLGSQAHRLQLSSRPLQAVTLQSLGSPQWHHYRAPPSSSVLHACAPGSHWLRPGFAPGKRGALQHGPHCTMCLGRA